ncbi:unnamed protein product [Mycena citricolor]|uniref:Uncharacterized protein n=1 Tax=Mycena citricolor TaxID=2018698 RepID=A0AAD2GYY2_9AGAR|nr:unnamed protein product [Mycena citricolor]
MDDLPYSLSASTVGHRLASCGFYHMFGRSSSTFHPCNVRAPSAPRPAEILAPRR